VCKKLWDVDLKSLGILDQPIGRAVDSRIRLKSWINTPCAVSAVTVCTVLAQWEDFVLVACLPKTGRTNQIRIHLAAFGLWIVGDKMYHPNEDVFIEYYEKGLTPWVLSQTLFSRHMLHNAFLCPEGREPFIAPIPQDILDLEAARKLMEIANIPQDRKEHIHYWKRFYAIF